jgi:hypothetical protein
MTSTITPTNNNQMNNLANAHYNLNGVYELTMISSIILAGFAEAAYKCMMNKDNGNNPLCIAPEDIIYNKKMLGGQRQRQVQKGGATLDNVNKRLIGNVIESANIDNATNSIMSGKFLNLFQAVNGKLFTLAENATNALIGINSLSSADIEKNITDFFLENKELLKKMTRDPEVQTALRDWVEEVGILNIQLLDMAKPTIDRLVSKSVETISDAGVQAARGVMSTTFNILEALIAEIPVAGGIADIIFAFMRGFNSAMQASAPIVEFSTEAFFRALKTAFTTLTILKTKGADIERAAMKVQGVVDNITAEMANVQNRVGNVQKGFANIQNKVANVQNIGANVLNKGANVLNTGANVLNTGANVLNTGVASAQEKAASAQEKAASAQEKVASAQEKVANVQDKVATAKDLEYAEKAGKAAGEAHVQSVLAKEPLTEKESPGGIAAAAAGGAKARANVHKRIKHVTRRLKNTINAFMNNKQRHIIYKNIKRTRKGRRT